jgi:hypothetical protein
MPTMIVCSITLSFLIFTLKLTDRLIPIGAAESLNIPNGEQD